MFFGEKWKFFNAKQGNTFVVIAVYFKGLTFGNCVSYIWDGHTAILHTSHFIYFFQQIHVLKHFTYRVCKNLNAKFRCQKVNLESKLFIRQHVLSFR
jgi:hypothetical protein